MALAHLGNRTRLHQARLAELLDHLTTVRNRATGAFGHGGPPSSLPHLHALRQTMADSGQFVADLADDLDRADWLSTIGVDSLAAGRLPSRHQTPQLVEMMGGATEPQDPVGNPTTPAHQGPWRLINVPGPAGGEILITPPDQGWLERLSTPPAPDDPAAVLPTPPAFDLGQRQVTPAPDPADRLRAECNHSPAAPTPVRVRLPPEPVWTPRRVDHVLSGDLTGGWHHRPGGADPPNRRVVRVTERITTGRLAGVYSADVEICQEGRCRIKPSTFFPDHWTRSRVIETVNQAYRRANGEGRIVPFESVTAVADSGFPVAFVVDETGQMVTAHPKVKTTR